METLSVKERSKLEKSASLHWIHWTVLGLSLCLTLVAWKISKEQLETRIETKFKQDTVHIVELIVDRMKNYEDSLLAGVAFHRLSPNLDYFTWKNYSAALQIEKRYPGINGIGVIYKVERSDLDEFLRKQRDVRPNFKIYPTHEKGTLFPITFIEPEIDNRKAVGLDMAHESNRLEALLKAKDTRSSQITGPIVLVQDDQKTPGFLFYAPFFDESNDLQGVVYAPFIVSRLMDGVLRKEKRLVSFNLLDGEQSLYEENNPNNPDYDSEPLRRATVELEMYGRKWKLELLSTAAFRNFANTSQPNLILIGGIFIDAMLLFLFTSICRANRLALRHAEFLESEVKEKTKDLERSNLELKHFASSASHDLKSPLRGIQTLAEVLKEDYLCSLPKEATDYVEKISGRAKRLSTLLDGLTEYASVERMESLREEEFSTQTLIEELAELFEQDGVSIVINNNLPTIKFPKAALSRVFTNLIDNAIKHHDDSRVKVTISSREVGTNLTEFSVTDNGPGIPKQFQSKIFEPFATLKPRDTFESGGFGLSIVQKSLWFHGGDIRVESEGRGSNFRFTVPTQ